MLLQALRDTLTREPYLRSTDGMEEYRRTVTALAWPWQMTPGAVVCLGERRFEPTVVGERRHLKLLDEVRSDKISELITAAERFLFKYKSPRIVTPDSDDRIRLLDVENDRRREEHKPPLKTQSPLVWSSGGAGQLPYFLGLLQSRIADEKTLMFGRQTSLPSEVVEAEAASADGTAKMVRYPGVCALCWCVEALDIVSRAEWGSELPGGIADPLGGY